MSRKRHRVPGTFQRGRALFVLPSIPDDLEPHEKNALAIRNAASVSGICPCCGATPELYVDVEREGVMHMVFPHEDWCIVVADGDAA